MTVKALSFGSVFFLYHKQPPTWATRKERCIIEIHPSTLSALIAVAGAGSLHLHDLDGFRQGQLAVQPLGGHEAHLASGSEELIEALEAPALTVYHPVIFEVAEHHHLVAVGDFRHIGRGVDGAVEDGVRGTCRESRLPEVLVVLVLQLADGLHRGIVHDPHSIPAIRCPEAVEQVDE